MECWVLLVKNNGRWPFYIVLATIALVCAAQCISIVSADTDPLRDYCVANPSPIKPLSHHHTRQLPPVPVAEPPKREITINGLQCKDPITVTAADFKCSSLGTPGNTNNALGFAANRADVFSFPGLNTQGLALARFDFADKGVNPPHVHPRASEIFFVITGTILAAFVDTAGNNFQQTLNTGDVFIFPRGLVHFQLNVGFGPATAIAAYNSQNPGLSLVADTLFASTPAVAPQVLCKTFGITEYEVEKLRQAVMNTSR